MENKDGQTENELCCWLCRYPFYLVRFDLLFFLSACMLLILMPLLQVPKHPSSKVSSIATCTMVWAWDVPECLE